MLELELLFRIAKPIQTTDDYDFNSLNIHYYHDDSVKKSEKKLYNDDGKTANAFEKGMYELLTLKSEVR